MIFLSYHHGFRGTPPQLCRLGSSLSSSWGWRCCCPCWVSPRRSHRSRACSRRGRLGFAARFGRLMCLCEFLWNSFDSFLILVERFLFFWDFWGIKGGLFRRYWGISWGSKVHPAGVGMIRLSVADHLEDAKGQFFSGPGWWLSNVAFYFLISGGFQGHKVLFIEELQGVFWWFFFACENLKSSHTFMGHPFITQWTPHITQLNQLNGMVFPGKNSLSFGDPLHVMPLVGAAVSTPRLARRADLDQLCRFDSFFFVRSFCCWFNKVKKLWNPQFSSSTSQFFAGLLIFIGDFYGEITTFFQIKCLGSLPGYGFVSMAIAPWTWTSESNGSPMREVTDGVFWRSFTGNNNSDIIMCLKQCHKPPMTGNGKFIPPIKMMIFLGDGFMTLF